MIEAAVASNSLVTGIQVVYYWKFLKIHDDQNSTDFISSDSANSTILNFFRTILMNSFQYDEQYFKTFPTTEIKDRNSNMKVTSLLFKLNTTSKQPQTIYAFAFFINDNYQNINTYVSDLLADNTVECAILIQNALSKNEQLCTVTQEICNHAYQIACIFRAGVEKILSISNIIDSDQQKQLFLCKSFMVPFIYTNDNNS